MEKINIEVYKRNWESIINDFTNRLNVRPIDIIEHNKRNDISEIRKLYCKLRYEVHMVSYNKIGHEIGRVHSTVIYSVESINNLLILKEPSIVEMWNKVKDIPGDYIEEKRQRLPSIRNPNGSMNGCNGQSENIMIWDMRKATQLTIVFR